MREIKFRAWTPLGMKLVDTIWFFEEEIDCEIDTKQPSHFNFKDIELMQYTGLKDVNGVEIYEGDIVTGDKPGYITKVKGVVKYGALAFAFVGETKDGKKWFDTITNPNITEADIEVIGNIYENPEIK